MSDIPKPNGPVGMVNNNRSFSSLFQGFLGLKSSSSTAIENIPSSSSGIVEDSNLKRNGTWAGFAGGEGQTKPALANSDEVAALESDENSYACRPPRPVSANGIREKVTWSFFNRHGKFIEEFRPESTGASIPIGGPIASSSSDVQTELRNDPMSECGANGLKSETAIQQSDEQAEVQPVKRRHEFFWSIMDESTVSNMRTLNIIMPLST